MRQYQHWCINISTDALISALMRQYQHWCLNISTDASISALMHHIINGEWEMVWPDHYLGVWCTFMQIKCFSFSATFPVTQIVFYSLPLPRVTWVIVWVRNHKHLQRLLLITVHGVSDLKALLPDASGWIVKGDSIKHILHLVRGGRGGQSHKMLLLHVVM